MKCLSVFLLSFFLGQGEFAKTESLEAKSLDAGKHTRTLEFDGVKRSFIVHVPATYDPRKPTPVVLALHGATMTASMMEGFTGLNKKSDEAGFVVVYPNGTGPGNL